MEQMAINLTSAYDELKSENLIEEIPDAEYAAACEEIREYMQGVDIEVRAMQAEAEQIAASVFLTV